MRLPSTLRRPLARLRRHTCEALGIFRYSRPALHGLDRALERHLDFNGGFFVEAGANDGFTQSNTYYFERCRGWSGILIEPIPELYERCRRNRPGSTVVQSALVAPGYAQPEMTMQYAGLMSVSEDAFDDAELRRRHVEAGMEQAGVGRTYRVQVPARTLSAIIAEHAGGREVDLLSLDIEGAELPALAGLDLVRHAPRYICVEARNESAVAEILAPRYDRAAVLWDNGNYQDLLFRRR
ncbi:MAG: FkbM family methyltransferase [Verrucomicrobia bacterium]|nr:FkbM family methyltransferase [Verrucomicrobiota bacterium]